jgi:hypothetical protein
MNTLENQPSPQSQLDALREEYDSLRQLVSTLLLVLLLVSGTLTIFLGRQWRFTKNEIEMLTPQASQILTDYNRNVPLMQDFVRKLNDYGQTHTDFAPIVAKYRLADALGKPNASQATNASLPAAPSQK